VPISVLATYQDLSEKISFTVKFKGEEQLVEPEEAKPE